MTTNSQTWQSPILCDVPDTNDAPVKTVDTVRQEMAQLIEKQLISDPGMLIVNVPAGVGKSYTAHDVAEVIADYSGQKISWFFPRHNGFANLERGSDWQQIRGRYGDIVIGGELIEPGNCDYADMAQALGKKGYSSARLICSPADEDKRPGNGTWKCPVERVNCPFWCQFENSSHWHLTHNFISIPKLWGESNQVVILDDLDASNLIPSPIVVNIPTLAQWIDKHPRVERYLTPLVEFLRVINTHLSDKPLHQALSDCIIQDPRLFLFNPDSFIKDADRIASLDEISELPDGRCKDFLVTLLTEISRYRDGKSIISRFVAHPADNGDGMPHFKFYPQMDLNQVDVAFKGKTFLELPSVLLNATCDTQAITHLLASEGYSVNVYAPNVALHQDTTITYCLNRNHSKMALQRKQNGYADEWIKTIEYVISQHKRTLVAATIEGERQLQRAIPGIETIHYGNLSGLNAYESYDSVVLAQPFNPNPIAVAERYRLIYGGIEGEPLNLETCYTQDVISSATEAYQVSVLTMADERLRPIYEHWRNSEHYQAVHRVRPILHKRDIYILFAIPVPNLPASEVIYLEPQIGRKSKMDELRETAIELLETQGYLTQASLEQAAGASHGVVVKHWDTIADELGLREVTIFVPSARRPVKTLKFT